MSKPTPTDASPTTEHPEPLGASSVALGSAGARATAETAKIVFAAIQVAQQLDRRSHIDPRQITKKIADLFRAMRDIFDKGRLNLKKFRENLEARRGGTESSKGTEKAKSSDARETEKAKTGKTDKTETTKAKVEADVEAETTKATNASSAVMAHYDIDATAAVWSMASLEDHKFAHHLADLAEARMRELDPGLMVNYDAAREKGLGRLDAMATAMKDHPEAGESFKAALAQLDTEVQTARKNRLEGRLVNQIAGIQQERIHNGQEPLNFEGLRGHFDEDPVSRGSHSYPEEMIDKVLSADYQPSPEVRQAAFDLKEDETERDAALTSSSKASVSKSAATAPRKRTTATKPGTKKGSGPATTARVGTTRAKPKPKAPAASSSTPRKRTTTAKTSAKAAGTGRG